MKNGITVIVLTKNEEKNILQCLESVKELADRVVVVDSGSTDKTVEIAKNSGAEVYFHEFENHGKQFNWALDNIGIDTKWVFRIDADEIIPPALREEIIEMCAKHEEDTVAAFVMRFKVYFLGRFLRWGGHYPFCKINLFKTGFGRFSEKSMHDNVVVEHGDILTLQNDALHFDQKDVTAYVQKHNWYASLEVQNHLTEQSSKERLDVAAKWRRTLKTLFYRLPMFWRAKLLYIYSYYLKLGFLDGRPGQIFTFISVYMYRFLVDAKIYEERVGEKGQR